MFEQESTQDSLNGFSGKVDQIQLSDLIQLACLAQMSRTIRLESGPRRGAIFVYSGRVAHAETGGLSGEEALLDMMRWGRGHFEIHPYEDTVIPTITKTWEYLLIEAMRLRTSKTPAEKDIDMLTSQTESSAFSGNIHQIPLPDLIQLVCMARTSHRIEVQWSERCGRIWVRMGQVCHASVLDVEGEEAFYEIFRWPGGSFEAVASCESEAGSIDKPWEFLLIEAMRIKDEKDEGGQEDENERQQAIDSLFQKVQKMKVAEKIRLAMTGDKEARTLLIRDSNRLVQFAIVNNPRISEGEVAVIANSKSVDEEVLRKIANNREWIKLYSVRLGLAKNPKTPLPIATKLVLTLMPQDLKLVAKSKAVPTGVAQAARRLLTQKD